MKSSIRTLAIGAAFASLLTGAAAQASDIRIGAMPTGSAWYVFGATLKRMIEPQIKGSNVEIIARGGGVANPMVVQNGRAEIALSNVATAVWARNGHAIYDGKKATDIRALVGGLNSVYVGAMVREAFIKQMGTDDLAKIIQSGKPVRFVMKPPGSSAVPAAEMILQSLGSSRDKIIADGGSIIQVAVSQIPSIIRDGKADILIDTVIARHPTITEISLTGNVRFVDLPKQSVALLEENGLATGPYGPWFKGQSGPNIGADLGTVLIAHAKLAEETAYQITKILCESATEMGESHAAWRGFKPEDAWKPAGTGIPLHPGAVRYYKERGWMK